MFTYIYIYEYTYIRIYVYTYIYEEREWEREWEGERGRETEIEREKEIFAHPHTYKYTYVYSHIHTYIPPPVVATNTSTGTDWNQKSKTICLGSHLRGFRNFGDKSSLRGTVWRRCTWCLKFQDSFRKRATNYRARLRKTTCKHNTSYVFLPRCTRFPHLILRGSRDLCLLYRSPVELSHMVLPFFWIGRGHLLRVLLIDIVLC